MPSQAVINDEIADVKLVVVYDAANKTALPFDRTVDGQDLSFYQVTSESELPIEFMDVETRSRWDMRGRALEGPLEGRQLQQVPAYNSMWFAWSTYWPDTAVWDGEGVIDDPPEITAVSEGQDLTPVHFSLAQNYPNPFNPFTQIEYQLAATGHVRLSVFNAAGQRIRTLVDAVEGPGLYLRGWDGRDDNGTPTASGVYIYRLQIPESGVTESKTMILAR